MVHFALYKATTLYTLELDMYVLTVATQLLLAWQ